MRAYSQINIKAVDAEARILRGVATTPSTDFHDDIVEPKGAVFQLPIPFLWQHDAMAPVGHVTKATVTAAGIEVEIQIARTEEPGLVRDRLEAAWADISLGLVRGLSIGFKPLETSRIEGTFGTRYTSWAWLELSGVTVAANSDCTIETIKAADRRILAGKGQVHVAKLHRPDAGRAHVVKLTAADKIRGKIINEADQRIAAERRAGIPPPVVKLDRRELTPEGRRELAILREGEALLDRIKARQASTGRSAAPARPRPDMGRRHVVRLTDAEFARLNPGVRRR